MEKVLWIIRDKDMRVTLGKVLNLALEYVKE